MRLVVAEKGLLCNVERVDVQALPASVTAVSPHGELPVMLDRDLSLHGAGVIFDYLDERYPHPPFLPADPVSRARTRLAARRIEMDWYALLPAAGDTGAVIEQKGLALASALAESDDVFAAKPYFLGDSYSLLDTMVAPLLWRLAHYGIVLPENATGVEDYARRMLARPGFRASLDFRNQEKAE